ncbi:hypothetical protein ACU18_00150 [Arthrobacter sp. ZBG10]|nr:hypothetical protein ACU18_00150 [Arthrobacter sp. ZBG10]
MPALVFAVFEFRVQLLLAEFGFGVRFAVGDDFMVQPPLNLAVENLQLFVLQFFQVFRKKVGGSVPALAI